jgi:hypothetical protein
MEEVVTINGWVGFEEKYSRAEMMEMMGATRMKQSEDEEAGDDMQQYKLMVVVQHWGQSAGEEHFITYRYGRAEERPGGWVLYNDEEATDKTWGEVKGKQASLLIYECYAEDPYRDKQPVQQRFGFSKGSTGAVSGRGSSRGTPASRVARF